MTDRAELIRRFEQEPTAESAAALARCEQRLGRVIEAHTAALEAVRLDPGSASSRKLVCDLGLKTVVLPGAGELPVDGVRQPGLARSADGVAERSTGTDLWSVIVVGATGVVRIGLVDWPGALRVVPLRLGALAIFGDRLMRWRPGDLVESAGFPEGAFVTDAVELGEDLLACGYRMDRSRPGDRGESLWLGSLTNGRWIERLPPAARSLPGRLGRLTVIDDQRVLVVPDRLEQHPLLVVEACEDGPRLTARLDHLRAGPEILPGSSGELTVARSWIGEFSHPPAVGGGGSFQIRRFNGRQAGPVVIGLTPPRWQEFSGCVLEGNIFAVSLGSGGLAWLPVEETSRRGPETIMTELPDGSTQYSTISGAADAWELLQRVPLGLAADERAMAPVLFGSARSPFVFVPVAEESRFYESSVPSPTRLVLRSLLTATEAE